MSIFAACGDGMEEATNGETSSEIGDNSNLETQYIEALKSAVNDDVLGFGETISGITLDDRVVTISVDMSNADTSMFGLKDVAETEFSRITDAALKFN